MSGLFDCPDVCYDEQASLLYRLAGQVVAHLRSYLKNDDEVKNVLQYHQKELVTLVHAQMQEHYEEKAIQFDVYPTKGFRTLKPNNYTMAKGEILRDYRELVIEKNDIRRMVFGGFKKCLYREQKFDSDSERRFAVVLENDHEVIKWLKPAKGQVQIFYAGDESYEPDFIVETRSAKYMCEPKAADEIDDKTVVLKARFGAEWCAYATEHARTCDGKPWHYLLIPHDAIAGNMTIQGFAARFAYRAEAGK